MTLETSHGPAAHASAPAATGSDHKRDQAMVLRNEITELRQSLLRAQEKEQEIGHERNFYRVKVSELTEILELKGGEETGKLVSKSLQNAELSMELDRLKRELHAATSTVHKLGEQREQNKRMLLELSGIVLALQSVQVDYHGPEHLNSRGSNNSLENVKAKVETIMEDRRLLVLRCQELEKENEQKDGKIAALEAQFHLLNSMNAVRSDIGETTSTSTTTAATPEAGHIHCPAITRSRSSSSVSTKNSTVSQRSSVMKIDANVIRTPKNKNKQLSRDDDDVSCASPTSATVSSVSEWNNRSPATPQLDEASEIKRLKSELAESTQRYQHFKQVCQAAFIKMKDVEAEFSEVKQECQQACSKRDQMRDHLKEVIDQYKELHQEYDQAVNDLEDIKSKKEVLEKTIKELEEEKEHISESGLEILEAEGLADDVKKLGAAYLKAQRTIKSLREKLVTAEREVEQAQKRQVNGGRNYRDAIAQCRKLQHETKILESRIVDFEEQLESAKKETLKYKEEAKHTRRRLTSYMRKEGMPVPASQASHGFGGSLMIPQLVTVSSEVDDMDEQYQLEFREAIRA